MYSSTVRFLHHVTANKITPTFLAWILQGRLFVVSRIFSGHHTCVENKQRRRDLERGIASILSSRSLQEKAMDNVADTIVGSKSEDAGLRNTVCFVWEVLSY